MRCTEISSISGSENDVQHSESSRNSSTDHSDDDRPHRSIDVSHRSELPLVYFADDVGDVFGVFRACLTVLNLPSLTLSLVLPSLS